jgi:hypothetical protein
MIKPHDSFEYSRADEVAECWDGVGHDLYAKLWNEIVPLQKSIPNLEDSGPHDHVGFENLASHWHVLTEDEQRHLNALAEKREAEWNEGYAKMKAEWSKP